MRVRIVPYIAFLYLVPSGFAFTIRDTKSTFSNDARIIGGEISYAGQFSYQVAVQGKIDNYDPFVLAGGALISKNYVLTVAHAVQMPGIQYIEVHLGAWQLQNAQEERKVITVYEDGFIVHEDFFIEEKVLNDIALLRLPEPIEFTDKIQPIALPTRSDANINMEGSYLLASGWGRYTDAHRNVSEYLQFVKLQVVNTRICKHYYDYLLPSMICTYTNLGKGTCQGDSGGPVVYTDPTTKRKFVAGLVSFGFYTCIEDGWPSVHTRVTSFLDWIAEHSDVEIL